MGIYFDQKIASANGPVAWTGHAAPVEDHRPEHEDVRVWYREKWMDYSEWLRIAPIAHDAQEIPASGSPVSDKPSYIQLQFG